ncbi:MAG: tRNA (adenosine(37)-N6)-dimethylallyltransferase MiaA [Polyangiaceae bacterium UTPRO1]|jgi:tRNA dimethylallyltransferase|nr:tRNA (adenosine(37)-N6)-dimethylallyltransferase MiaA [Myxococcales bacterium]OQY68872.1 MAG: tRNA (adenosine(37)-N6)-dimethylallyltransferase MiaA [Polyangiaceae bacterium UTPRO1]
MNTGSGAPERARTRVLAIVGPTAAGKSAVAMRIAERLDAEIVSADSRQIYRGLDIGTAKPSADDRRRVPHHLLDVADPDQRFDAARFRHLALAAIAGAAARGRPVVVCGGTGLYLRALRHGLFAGPGAVPELRAALYERERLHGPGTLHADLAAADPAAASRLHPHDTVRLVRALEVLRVTGRPISAWQDAHAFAETSIDMQVFGCARPREDLHARIAARCGAMIDAGLLTEIRELWDRGYGPELPPLDSVGYREMGAYLRGDLDFAAACDAFARATRRLAKRQLTWWRSDATIAWFHPDRDDAAILTRAAAWLSSPCPSPISTSSSPSLR